LGREGGTRGEFFNHGGTEARRADRLGVGRRGGAHAKPRSREEDGGRFLATEGTEGTERGFMGGFFEPRMDTNEHGWMCLEGYKIRGEMGWA